MLQELMATTCSFENEKLLEAIDGVVREYIARVDLKTTFRMMVD
jgi:hypothetical protein